MNIIRRFSILFVFILAACAPFTASAHEVYVLTPAEISSAVSMPSPNPFTAIPSHELQFLLWGAISAVAILVALAISVSKLFERIFDPLLMRLKKYAPLIGRLTLGISLLASGYYHALFGPELPLSQLVGSAAGPLSVALMVLGTLIVLGFYTRWMAGIALCIFALAVFQDKAYMLTYANYLGEIILSLILGSGAYSFDWIISKNKKPGRIAAAWEPYGFLVLRVFYGTAVFFASFYAKFLHSNLALYTVNDYHLTNYFHFTPLFLVLGAFIVEALLGICFATGFEIRMAALFFTFFLTLSLLFFGEVVWPHIVLFGVNIALFCHGYDRYTLEYALFERKRKGEPVL